MARQPLKFLSDQQVADIHERLMARDGGEPGYRQGARLGAVLERVRNLIRFGGSRYTCPDQIAALTTFAIAIGQPFNDGNRRTALACGLVVLRVNGRDSEPEQVQAVRLLAAACAGEIDQSSFIEAYLALLNPAPGVPAQSLRSASS